MGSAGTRAGIIPAVSDEAEAGQPGGRAEVSRGGRPWWCHGPPPGVCGATNELPLRERDRSSHHGAVAQMTNTQHANSDALVFPCAWIPHRSSYGPSPASEMSCAR